MMVVRWLQSVIEWLTRPGPDVRIPMTPDGVARKMERFTQRSRRVLSLAQTAAESLRHKAIEPEHMLAGMMQEDGSIGAAVMRRLGAEAGQISALVAELNPPRTDDLTLLELSSGTRRTLENAVDEARKRSHHYIGTEHLLLGIARLVDQQPTSVSARLFQRLNLNTDALRTEVNKVLEEHARQQAAQPTAGETPAPSNPAPESSQPAPEITDQPPQDKP
jgi:ATP-dependent Clp protease ATP-binding subunit ClpC